MSKVLTFSRFYPSYHPKAGQPTFFVEKIVRSIFDDRAFSYKNIEPVKSFGGHDITTLNLRPVELFEPKHHTIRAGHRFKAGDWFSPRVWGDDINPKSGKKGPYHSKQITFAPDIQVKKVWSFSIVLDGLYIDQQRYLILSGLIKEVAANDGLDLDDFLDWFRYPREFTGQIICWNESIDY